MHGRKKVPLSEAKEIEKMEQTKSLKEDYENAMSFVNDPTKLDEFAKTRTPILFKLSDFATIWRIRKQYFEKNATDENLKIELEISLDVIKRNPKCYWAWHHRRWCLELMKREDLSEEVELTTKLLIQFNDFRNFHAWRHRRWAVMKMGNMYDKELENTSEFLEKDCSNYSAWHYRSQLPVEFDFVSEIKLTENAMWTDPNDQSSWFYYRWLLHRPSIKSDQKLLHEQFDSLQGLIEEDEKIKYPYLASIWIQRLLDSPDEEKIKELKEKLCQIDPIRAPYYNEL